jgi:hypothetical protein
MNKKISFLIILAFHSGIAQQIHKDTVDIEEVTIEGKIDVGRIVKKITANIDKNYSTNETLFLKTVQESIKDTDTIVKFNGVLQFTISNYKKFSAHQAELCNAQERKVKNQQFIDWFPSRVGKLSKEQKGEYPDPSLSFFIDDSYSLFAIKQIPFIKHSYQEFDITPVFLLNNELKLSFKAKNNDYPLEGYVIIDKKTHAVLETYYRNYNPFKVYQDTYILPNYSHIKTTFFVEHLEIKVKYQKNNKYSFSSLEASSVFEVENSRFTSQSKVEVVAVPETCIGERITLIDLGLVFKQNQKDSKKNSKIPPSLLKTVGDSDNEN